MSIWNYTLTDNKSAMVRLALRLLWFLLGFVFMLPFLLASSAVIYLLAAGLVYLLLVGFLFDHWKLRCPEVSRAKMQWAATLAMLPVLAGFPVVIFLFR